MRSYAPPFTHHRTANDLQHLYADAEISTRFHQLWQKDGWLADQCVALWLKAVEMVAVARHERAGQHPVLLSESPADADHALRSDPMP